MRLGPSLLVIGGAIGTLVILTLPPWHLPLPAAQIGPDGQGMVQWAISEPAVRAVDQVPAPAPRAPADPRPVTVAYKNVQVVTDVNAGDFMSLQNSITQWVAPKEGCGFCHTDGDFASDAKATKRVAREMLRMTRTINADWTDHVGTAGVTCYTCHRGAPVPGTAWFPRPAAAMNHWTAKAENWNETARTVRDFFPDAGWWEYLVEDNPGIAISPTALPTGGTASPIVVKRLYEMMMQMSDGIGVNCGFCHASRAFQDWEQSTPARWIGHSGLQLTKAINRNFLLPIASLIPQLRELPGVPRDPVLAGWQAGWQDGNALAVCATCHYFAPKPLGGADLVSGNPGLKPGAPGTAPTTAVDPNRRASLDGASSVTPTVSQE